MLMSALTGDDIAEIDCPEAGLKLAAGDRVILSSDGLDTLAHEKIVEIAANSETSKDCVEALIKGVEDAGAPRQDNTTVIVIDVTEKPEVAPEPETVPAKQEDEDDLTRPAFPPPSTKEPETPFEVVDAPRTGSPVGMIVAVVVILAVLGGGGFWFMTQGEKAPAPTPTVVEDDDLVDMEPVEEEPMVPGEVVPDAKPVVTPTPAPAPGNVGEFRDRLKAGGEGPQMVWLSAGEFMMGSNLPTSDPAERPYHKVALAQFAMGVNEVSVAEYRKFAEATARKMPNVSAASGDEAYFPMFYASWEDALAYTQWLSQQTGKDYRLPSEAQWEYAARAGSDMAYWWGRKLGRSNAHCFACDTGLDPRRPTAVSRFNANKFGLYDTAGNVQEWVYDCHHKNYDAAPEDGSVFEGGDCTVRVLRGGSYGSGPGKLRSAARDKFRFDKGNDQTGFRVVLTP